MKSRSRISIQQTQRLKLTQGLAASLKILRSDALGLSRYLEEQAAENPQLVLGRPAGQDWLPRWKSALGASGGAPDGQPEQAAATPSLIAHVLGQIDAMQLSDKEARIAEALAEALEPSGWLGQTTAAIATRTGATLREVELLLRRLQARAEPSGLFARNLADCLRLQAEDADEMDAVMAAVLTRLDLVALGDLDRLARDMGVAVDAVRLRIGRLRAYDPKPGAGFEPFAAPIREPDLLAEKGPSGWTVAINRSALPSVSLAEGKGPGRAEAQAILRMVEGRNVTLLAVGQEILARQVAALDQGPGGLVPMTMADVASAVGLHESTVSRVVAGTAVDTPRGTWWLRALFTQSAREGGPAAGALRDRLARLIAAEDPAAPLTDDALAAALSEAGATLARRTVAKYRAMLNLPAAARRKRRSHGG